ncbi:hypothetical protein Daus18300_013947 [Diaporthe australafricana]|uniref:Uncharacterized protein n=1 Tax=Diaporthe australafricana TaxID=127596 RepID=A0ABR3VX57_9PEZI
MVGCAEWWGPMVSKSLEPKINEKFGAQAELEIEHWVTAHVLLLKAGQIGDRTDEYWKTARSLAQEQFYLNPDLRGEVQQKMLQRKHQPQYQPVWPITHVQRPAPSADPVPSPPRATRSHRREVRAPSHAPCHREVPATPPASHTDLITRDMAAPLQRRRIQLLLYNARGYIPYKNMLSGQSLFPGPGNPYGPTYGRGPLPFAAPAGQQRQQQDWGWDQVQRASQAAEQLAEQMHIHLQQMFQRKQLHDWKRLQFQLAEAKTTQPWLRDQPRPFNNMPFNSNMNNDGTA